jgi:hypothetical protein
LYEKNTTIEMSNIPKKNGKKYTILERVFDEKIGKILLQV